MIVALVSIAAAAGVYLVAKKKRAGTGTAVAAGVVTGAGSAAALGLLAATWPVLLVFGVPAAAFYYYGKSKGQEKKMLGP